MRGRRDGEAGAYGGVALLVRRAGESRRCVEDAPYGLILYHARVRFEKLAA